MATCTGNCGLSLQPIHLVNCDNSCQTCMLLLQLEASLPSSLKLWASPFQRRLNFVPTSLYTLTSHEQAAQQISEAAKSGDNGILLRSISVLELSLLHTRGARTQNCAFLPPSLGGTDASLSRRSILCKYCGIACTKLQAPSQIIPAIVRGGVLVSCLCDECHKTIQK